MSILSGCGSVWLERRLREAEAASSNLVTPTWKKSVNKRVWRFIQTRCLFCGNVCDLLAFDSLAFGSLAFGLLAFGLLSAGLDNKMPKIHLQFQYANLPKEFVLLWTTKSLLGYIKFQISLNVPIYWNCYFIAKNQLVQSNNIYRFIYIILESVLR